MAKRLWDKGQAVDEFIHGFTVGTDPEIDLSFAKWDVFASAAHAQLLLRIKVLSDVEYAAILRELSKILKLIESDKFRIPTELEDCHTAIEALLTEALGDAGKKIHTGRSRNDQVMVAVRLYLKDSVLSITNLLLELATTLEQRIESDGKLPLPGYTHFQRAMPASVGMWLQSFHEWCIEAVEDGERLLDSIDSNPLGVASGFGIPLKLDRAVSSEMLGFARVQRNPIYVQSSRGRFELKVMRWYSDIAALGEKLACDLMLFTTAEFGFCSLPNSLTTGSSIMPQKRNPDVVELLRASASRVRALEAEVLGIIAKLPSNYHRDYQLTKEPLVCSTSVVGTLLMVANSVVNSLQFNPAKLAAAMSSDLYATYQVYRAVRAGKSFRDAYQETAAQFETTSALDSDISSDFSIIEEKLAQEIREATLIREKLSGKIAKAKEAFRSIRSQVGLS